MPEDFFRIKKYYVYLFFTAIFFFTAGLLITRFYPHHIQSGTLTQKEGARLSQEDKCKLFCEFANAEYDHLGKDSHCYCNKEQTLFDTANNRTITITQSIDVGIIKDVKIEEGLPKEP